MESKWFEEVVQNWSHDLEWPAAQLATATETLKALAAANRGTVLYDVEFDESLARDHARRQAELALARRTTEYAKRLHALTRAPMYTAKSEGPPTFIDAVTYHQWNPAIDVNSASSEQLQILHGVGPALADAIVRYRERFGPFESIETLQAIAGISSETIEKFGGQAVAEMDRTLLFRTTELADFLKKPNFDSYVRLVAETQGSFVWSDHGENNVFDQIQRELEAALEDTLATRSSLDAALGGTRASSIKSELGAASLVRELFNQGARDINIGAVLHDSRYVDVVEQAIESAQSSIYLMMFFFRYLEDKEYPTDRLINGLIAAQEREVDVKVIFDRDLPGQKFRSHEINRPAYSKLRSSGVSVRYDPRETLQHSKLLIVDKYLVITGSHNWTAGSFFAYDDTSLYIESSQLGQHYSAMFEELWTEFGRRIPLEL